MNKKTAILISIVLLLLVAIGGGTYLVMNRQVFFSNAQQTTTSTAGQGSSCSAPGTPATVTLSYPLCESVGSNPETCQFDKAGCNWEAVSGATNYNVKATEVETGVVVKTETVTTTKTSFPVVQGRTYKCEVSAVNACGTGETNEDSLLCQVDAIVSPPPVATAPPPVVVAPPVSTPPPVACGATGCSTTVPCQAGFVCVQTSVGQNYCTRTEYQSYCFRNPGQAACCEAPAAPPPVLPDTGLMDNTLLIGGVGAGFLILGAAALLLL